MDTFFDAHTHVQFAAFDADRDDVIRRARDAGVRFINAGTERTTSRAAVDLARAHEGVFAAVGLHPTHTGPSFADADELGGDDSQGEIFDAAYYRELAHDPKTVAIGECGLDFFYMSEGADRVAEVRRQTDAFLAQIALAAEVRKPLVIHCRAAFPELIGILKEHRAALSAPPVPGVVHFFTGTIEDARQLLELGFSFTFGGAVTFPPRKGRAAGDYDELIGFLPPDRILSETDAPYVAPVPCRGKRNEPAYVIHVAQRLAALKGLSGEEMALQIRQNAERIFGISAE